MNKIERIQIKSVDFSILTFLSVKCDNFEDYFKNYESVTITDTALIKELVLILHDLKTIDSTYSKEVDTRAKIVIYSETDTNTLCVGNLSLSNNKKIYKTPQKLIDFIEKK